MMSKLKILLFISMVIGSVPLLLGHRVHQQQAAWMAQIGGIPGVEVTLHHHDSGWLQSKSIYHIHYQSETQPSERLSFEWRYQWNIHPPLGSGIAKGYLTVSLLNNKNNTSLPLAQIMTTAFLNGEMEGQWKTSQLRMLGLDSQHGLFADELEGNFQYSQQQWQWNIKAHDVIYQNSEYQYYLSKLSLRQEAKTNKINQPVFDFVIDSIEPQII